MENGEALETDWKAGNIEKRLAADAAIGRKQNGEQTRGNAARPDSSDPSA
jgi:hypothetical protein